VIDSLDFDRILDLCLDRLQTGATVADCLANYPQHAAQLAPLLQVAGLLETPAGPKMSADGLRAGEARLLAQAARLRTRRQARTFPLVGITRRLAAAGIAGTLLVCGMFSAGTVSAAAASLPGSPLYPVKQATEALVTWAAFTPQLKTTVHLAWADRRLGEAEALLAVGATPDASVLAALGQETEQALTAAEQSGPEQLAAVAAQTEHQQAVLQAVLDKAPAVARPGLLRALTASANGHARAKSALDKAHPGKATEEHPTNTPPGQAAPGKPTEESLTGTPTGQATAEPPTPTGTPTGQPTVELPTGTPTGQPTEELPTGTPTGQPTVELPTGTPTPDVIGSPEPTSTVIVETPTPAGNNGQGNDEEKKDKEKKDKKDKKDKDK